MKICYITLGFTPAVKLGGPVSNAYHLTRALAQRGHEVSVWCGNLADKSTKLFEGTRRSRYEAVEVVYFDTYKLFPVGAGSFGVYAWPDLASFCRRELRGFDVVHLDGYRDYPTLTASYFCRKWFVPYVLQARGTMRAAFNSFVAKRIYDKLLGKAILAGCNRFVASSGREAEDYAAFVQDRSRIIKIYNGVSRDEFADIPPRGEFRKRLGLSDQLIIAYLGRLHPAKGIDVLMRAFAGAGWPQGARLVIIGPDEGFRGSLTALSVELGIQEAVIFVDALRGRDKLSAYADSDLVVYAGQSESFGMVPIESLMCGTPVVISEACGCREVIEGFKSAHVVPYGDVGALIAEIERTALRGQVARAGAEEAREALSRLLSWESICEQYENAYLRAGGDAPTITFHTEPSARAVF